MINDTGSRSRPRSEGDQEAAGEGTLDGSLIGDTDSPAYRPEIRLDYSLHVSYYNCIRSKFCSSWLHSYKEGAPEIGFGTVNDNGQLVVCETFGSAPVSVACFFIAWLYIQYCKQRPF